MAMAVCKAAALPAALSQLVGFCRAPTLNYPAPSAPADTQKCVVRTPFVSALHTQPEQYAPITLGTAKVIAGLVHGGLLGALRMALSRT